VSERARGGVLLRDHDFRTLWAGTTVAQFGSSVGQLAIPLLAVGALAATPLQMGLLSAAQTVGFLLIGLPAGAWVDRSRRLRLMLAMDVVRCAVLLTVPACWWLGVLTMPQLVVTAFAVGLAAVFFEVAYGSYLPSLVGKQHLLEGNAKLQASQSFASMAGPSLGGVLAGLVGAANTVLCTAAGFAVSAVQLWRIRAVEPRPARPARRDLAAEIGEGLRFVFGNAMLRAIACCTAMSNLFMAVAAALTVLFLNRVVGLSPAATGLVLVSIGVGGGVGVLTARRIAARLGQSRTIWVSMAVSRPFGLLLALTYPGWQVAFFVVGWFMIGFGNSVYNIAQVTFRQSMCPDHLLGRMNASNRVLAWGTLPLGGVLGGALGQWVGVRTALWIVALGLILSVAWLLLSPLRAVHDVPDVPDVPAQPGAAPRA
jgi:MFS family permease